MKQLFSISAEDGTCVKVFDPETRTLLAIYDNKKRAATALGVAPAMIHKAVSDYTQIFSKILGKKVACRLRSRTDDAIRISAATLPGSGLKLIPKT